MFVYRALNESDLNSLEKNNSISACISSLDGFMDQIIPHILKGSMPFQRDCWISACKDFMVCVTEYAIPQNGKYNTVNGTKPIVVIDLDEWLDFASNDYVRNYTVFLDKNQEVIPCLRLSDLKEYPLPYYCNNTQSGCRYLNNGRYTVKDLRYYSKKFKDGLNNNIQSIRYGIMDCSMKKIDSPIRAVQELSVYNFPSNTNAGTNVFLAGWVMGKTSVMTKGPAVKATEILFLGSIPRNLIKAVLSHFVQALLSMIEQEYVRDAVLQAIIDKRIIIKENFNESYVEIIHKNQSHYIHFNRKELFLNPLIDFLDEKSPTCVELQYEELIKQKSDMVKKVLKEIMLLLYGQTGALINGEIPEESGIKVREISSQKNRQIGDAEKYDILAIRYRNELFRYKEALQKLEELKKSGIIDIK